ncbi:MAG: argininosuccinate lyase [Magnetococcus sp. DMHC-6]
MADSVKKLWGGRFSQPTDAFVELFTASIHVDVRLFRQDIRASQVHSQMLARVGILTQQEAATLCQGLSEVEQEIEQGELLLQTSLEDIHMHVESRLAEKVGGVAGKLHTARSRNDQVATDLRLYVREEVDAILVAIHHLQEGFLNLAKAHIETILPGFTHMQNAQPISFAHHLLAYYEMLARDYDRFWQARGRMNRLPLGCAALAGTPYPVDREWVAEQLGFEGLCENSLDAVSDRDFAIELAAHAAILMMHLSRFSEELILWSSPIFGFIELSDGFCTGSSIMPQKKNPDVPELVRGKTGRVNGHLMALLTLMKGLPLAYNRDMQEDKEAVFDTLDTVRGCLRVMGDLLPGMTIHREKMAAAAGAGYTTATDLADYLVQKSIPFRQAHEIVGRIVRRAIAEKITLEQMTLAQMQEVDPRIEADVALVLTVEASINARKARGGTAFATVREAIQRIEEKKISHSLSNMMPLRAKN